MTILRIDSSIRGEESVSRVLTKAISDALAAGSGDRVVHRDLGAEPLAHMTERGQDPHILDEFLAADTVVIGAPTYNFSIPSNLKAWIDRLAVAGRTFRYSETGPEGLVKGKRVVVAVTSDGAYEDGNPFEHVKSYLQSVLSFMGIEPEWVEARGLAMNRDDGLGGAHDQIERLAA